uniref:Uncharacterized protein n=1 Tax=Siphoviridae sp. ctGDt6 TaxID=2825408 RepID=A0A8S5U804_9CAUD|nr:MAG TPA: hypothetical protein [Siphoviridae sp. ctGDt6]
MSKANFINIYNLYRKASSFNYGGAFCYVMR